MKHGIWLRTDDTVDTRKLVEFAVEAEAAGWDGVFVSDSITVSEYPDPWPLLSSIASRTQEIYLGTWVIPVPRRQPWQVAKEVATVDNLSNGRVILGAGLGEAKEYEPFGREYNPGELGNRFDEALEVIRGLWMEESFSFDGDHFTLKNVTVRPRPNQQRRIPILVGGLWPNERAMQRGADWDGIMPVGKQYPEQQSKQELQDMISYYRSQTEEPGEILIPRDLPGTTPTFLDLCHEHEATWLLTTGVDSSEYIPGEYSPGNYTIDLEYIRNGPPERQRMK